MGAEVDSLEIAVKTTADEANKSLDILIRKLGLVAEGLSAMTKDSGLSDFSKKIANLSKDNGLLKISNMKDVAKSGTKFGKTFGDNIIKEFNIQNKEVQANVREMAQSLSKMSIGEIASGKEIPEYLTTLDKLGETVSKNAQIIQSRMGIYDNFYKYFQGIGKIEIPDNVVNELGDDWKNLQKTAPKNFSRSGSGIELDSIYQEMSGKYKDLFSGTADQTQQFREIISALQAYRADIDKLEPVDPQKITGFEDGMWDSLYQGLSEMRQKITDQMSGLSENISKSAEEIREQYAELGKDFSMSGSEKQLENKLQSLTNSLENAKLKQKELEASGNTDGKTYENTVASVVKYENQIESLTAQLDNMRESARLAAEEAAKVDEKPAASIAPNPDVFTGTINGGKSFSDVEQNVEEARKSVNVAASDMQYDAAAMAAAFGESAAHIRDWAQAVSEMGGTAGMALNNPELFQETTNGAETAKQSVSSLSEEIQSTKTLMLNSFKDSGSIFKSIGAGLLSGIKAVFKEIPGIAKAAFNGIYKAAQMASGPIRKLTKGVHNLLNPFKKLSIASKGTNKSFLQNMWTIARYAIGVRSLFTLINKLKKAFADGLQNLVKYSSETNASMSLLMNSTNQLKNSVAAAASPLLNALAPALNAIIQLCINAANAINQLFSALTGHGTWIKAKKQTQDYAKSLGGASKAADDLKTHTLGIDELNVVDKDKSSGSGGGGGLSGSDMFETQEIDSKYKEWSNKIKSMWDMGDFTELGASIGSWLKKGLDSIPWGGIQESARKIASCIGTFINGFVETDGLATSIGTTIGQVINTGVDFANTLLDVTHWDSIGKFIGDGLNGVINSVQWDELGQMLANGLNAWYDILYNAATTFDWTGVGDALSLGLNTFISTHNWAERAYAASAIINGILDAAIEFTKQTDWGALGEYVVDYIEAIDWGGMAERLVSAADAIVQGILDFCISAVETLDWIQLGTATFNELIRIITSIDYAGIISKGFELFGACISASYALAYGIADAVWNLLVSGFNATKAYFDSYIQAAGGDIILGLFNGIVDALKSVGQWITENILNPFMDGIKSAFGIHSPSTVMAEIGGYLIEGLFNGIKNGWNTFKNSVGEIAQGVIDKFKDVLGIHSPSTVMDENGVYLVEGLKNGITGTMDDVYNLFTRSKWEELGQDMLNGLTAPFTTGDGLGIITDFANNTVQVVSDTLSAHTFEAIGTNAVSSLASGFTLSGLTTVFKNIQTALQNVWSETTSWWQGTAMPNFFNANVKPWFTSTKWKSEADGMKLGLIAKWDEFVSQWKSKLKTWWSNDVKTWFTTQRWNEQGDNIKNSLIGKWTEFSTEWQRSISTWFSKDVSTWFTKEKWSPFGENMKNGLYEGFSGIAKKVGDLINGLIDTMNKGLSNLTDALNDLIDRYNDVADEVGGDDLGHIDYSDAKWVDIPAYAAGGFPEDGMFFANHNEMVGQFSNGKTAVANNEQIVAGITAGVREAVMDVLAPYLSQIADNTRETANKNTSISIDGRELVSAINNRVSRNGFSFT